jgi:hypothetical protein
MSHGHRKTTNVLGHSRLKARQLSKPQPHLDARL